MLWRKAWKAASEGWIGAPEALGRAGMGGIGVSDEDCEPCTENQDRCLRLLPALSSEGRSLKDLRPVMSLERLWRFKEFLDFGCADVLCTSSEVKAVPGCTMPMLRPVSLELDL